MELCDPFRLGSCPLPARRAGDLLGVDMLQRPPASRSRPQKAVSWERRKKKYKQRKKIYKRWEAQRARRRDRPRGWRCPAPRNNRRTSGARAAQGRCRMPPPSSLHRVTRAFRRRVKTRTISSMTRALLGCRALFTRRPIQMASSAGLAARPLLCAPCADLSFACARSEVAEVPGRYYLTDEMYNAMEMPEGRNQFLKHFDVDMPKEMVCLPALSPQVPCASASFLRACSQLHGGLAGEGRRLQPRSIHAILLLRLPGLERAPKCVRATAKCVEGQSKGCKETL